MKSVFLLFYLTVLIDVSCRGQWQQLQGPTGGQTGEMLEAGGYLFVNGIQGGIYRSSDEGLSWQPVNSGLPADFTTWAFSTYNTKIYVANSTAAYYSDDFGNSWALLTAGLDDSFKGFYSIDVFGNEIYGGSYGGFYYSPDHGQTWTFMPGKFSNEQILGIKFLDNKIWIGSTKGFYFSDDKGITWTLKLDISVRYLLQHEDQLWIGGNDPAFRLLVMVSYDKGMTFSEPNVTITLGFVNAIFVAGNEVYVTTGTTYYYYSPNNGVSWSQKTFPSYYSAVNVSGGSRLYKKGSLLFITYSDGILCSTDMGNTWNKRNIGLLNQSISETGLIGSTAICNADNSGIFYSTNDGGGWLRENDPAVIFPESFHIEKNTIVVGTARNVYKSLNYGQTWQKLLELESNQEDDDYRIYFTGHHERLMLSTIKGVHFSKDLGASWKFKSNAELNFKDRINRHYIKGDTVILETTNRVFTSTDFGETWDEKTAPLKYLYSTGCIMNAESLILATVQGFYISYDFGESWEARPCAPFPINDIKKVGNDIFIATRTGVYATPNQGIDWYAVNENLQSTVNSIVFGAKYTFAGTYGRSMWRRHTAEVLAYGNGQVAALEKPEVKKDCEKLTITNYTNGKIAWYKNNELIPNETLVDLKTRGSGLYKASITTTCGMLLSSAMVVDDTLAKPIVNVDCSTLVVTNADSVPRVIWYLNGNQISTDTQVTSQQEGTYRVEFQNSCGSVSSDPIILHSREDIDVYNIITPNGDGKNDFYRLPDALAGSEFLVYNRWGNLIYRSPAYENNWSGEGFVSGEYFYMINNNCFGTYKGVLTISR